MYVYHFCFEFDRPDGGTTKIDGLMRRGKMLTGNQDEYRRLRREIMGTAFEYNAVMTSLTLVGQTDEPDPEAADD